MVFEFKVGPLGVYPTVFKPIIDILVSLIFIVLASPILIAVSIFIFICSPGPVFFVQQRVGRNGQIFNLLKFRTMRKGGLGSATTTLNDPRVYSGGHFLRKYKIDEVPQIFNVLLGDMSIVGPRPTVESDYVRMDDRQKNRVKVRPGLTGLAQINGNTELTWPERIELDLRYIEVMSIELDLKVVLKTIFLVFTGRADTHPKTDDEWG